MDFAPPQPLAVTVKESKDRRFMNDRRRRQLAFIHVERRHASRRDTELQAFMWATLRA